MKVDSMFAQMSTLELRYYILCSKSLVSEIALLENGEEAKHMVMRMLSSAIKECEKRSSRIEKGGTLPLSIEE